MMAEDFLCNYQPWGGPVIAADPVPQSLTWAADAAIRLERIPGFVRRMVRKRAETHVRGMGRSVVTLADLEYLAVRRFGPKGPPGPRRPRAASRADGSRDA